MPLSRAQIQQMFLSDAERSKLKKEEIFNRSRNRSTDNNLTTLAVNTAAGGVAGFLTGGPAGAVAGAGMGGLRSLGTMMSSEDRKVAFDPLGSATQGISAGGIAKQFTTPVLSVPKFDSLPTPSKGTPIRPIEAYTPTMQVPDINPKELGLVAQGIQSDNLGGALSSIQDYRDSREAAKSKSVLDRIKLIGDMADITDKGLSAAQKQADRSLTAIQYKNPIDGSTIVVKPDISKSIVLKNSIAKADQEAIKSAQDQANETGQPVDLILSNGKTITANRSQSYILNLTKDKAALEKVKVEMEALRIAIANSKRKLTDEQKKSISPATILNVAAQIMKDNNSNALPGSQPMTFKEAVKQAKNVAITQLNEFSDGLTSSDDGAGIY